MASIWKQGHTNWGCGVGRGMPCVQAIVENWKKSSKANIKSVYFPLSLYAGNAKLGQW